MSFVLLFTEICLGSMSLISLVWRTTKKRCTNCLADNIRSEMEKKRYIAIACNIGAGKSSLTSLLGKSFGWETYYESVEGNPYLSDFYDDMRRWSFNLQIGRAHV